MMAKCDPRYGSYLGILLMCRGNSDLKEQQAANINVRSRKTIEFIDWGAKFKCDRHAQPPTAVPGSEIAKVKNTICMVANNSEIRRVFSKINHKFDLMHAKKAYLHWYVRDGMEEGEFEEARENLAALEGDYAEIAGENNEEGMGEEGME